MIIYMNRSNSTEVCSEQVTLLLTEKEMKLFTKNSLLVCSGRRQPTGNVAVSP